MPASPLNASTASIVAPRLFDGTQWHEMMAVTFAQGRITHLGPAAAAPPDAVVLPPDAILAPGFIDAQVNGGGGMLLNDAPAAATVITMLQAHRAFGTTGFMPTLITDSYDTLSELAANAAAIAAIPGVLGLHLEGPYLNPKRKGVHPAEFIRAPEPRDIEAIAAIARQMRLLLTLAPECVPAGFIARMAALGIVVAIGHSDATAAQLDAAVAEGATAVTHLFNAMSQVTPREPGVVGATFDNPRIRAGLICDGEHVAPANMRTAFKMLGRDRLALVTDAMPSIGADSAKFELHGRTISLAHGRLTAPDGTLAGAHLGMSEAVRNAVSLMRVSLEDALVMASASPAQMLQLDTQYRQIRLGGIADFTALSSRLEVVGTWIHGRGIGV